MTPQNEKFPYTLPIKSHVPENERLSIITKFVLIFRLLFGYFVHSIGLPYYLNVYTKESQWELPTSPAKPDGDSSKDAGQVQCAHLLVKHKGSRRPSSWREENITRTKEEARAILNGYYQKVRKNRK